MGSKKVIFIGGVHGVGKTTICNNISNGFGIKHYSSSSLITRIKSDKVNINKKVGNIEGNQNILLEAINEYVDEQGINLLDGHFCLIDENGLIKNIPLETFSSISILEIIVLVDNPENIVERLKNRDSNVYTLDFIKYFQDQEIKYAKLVSKKLNIRLNIIDMNEKNKYIEKFSDLISSLLK